MSATIRAIGTAVPATRLDQVAVRDLFLAQPDLSRLGRRIVGAAFDGSAVDTRHSVIAELDTDAVGTDAVGTVAVGTVAVDTDAIDTDAAETDAAEIDVVGEFVDRGVIRSPSTRVRNDRYRELATPLFVSAARDALVRAGVDASAVTHVVTVSCTGFTQPGPDLAIAQELGMRPGVFRHHVGFMGCYAAFPALRMADAFCAAEPDAVVLVVCAEVCTLHVRVSDDPDQIVANSVFADGAAAAVVTSGGAGLRLDAFATTVIPEGAGDMAWNIGDEGFEMVLSTAVPKLIEEHVREAVEPVLVAGSLRVEDVPLWAVHPGGRSIVDRVEAELELPASAVAASRRILAEYGNMSSATVLFVLDCILRGAPADGTPVVALAFGPGLTVESAALTVAGA